jgi:hypothetical protein
MSSLELLLYQCLSPEYNPGSHISVHYRNIIQIQLIGTKILN